MSHQNPTPSQRAFCKNRFRHPELTAAQRHMRAYPKCKSENVAAVEASRNLKKPKIQNYIEELNNQAANIGLYPGRILREEACLAFYDPREMIDPTTGEILSLTDLSEHMARAIVGVKIIKTKSIYVQLPGVLDLLINPKNHRKKYWWIRNSNLHTEKLIYGYAVELRFIFLFYENILLNNPTLANKYAMQISS
jgi:hypothetical protein